jgi:hypothetical protein
VNLRRSNQRRAQVTVTVRLSGEINFTRSLNTLLPDLRETIGKPFSSSMQLGIQCCSRICCIEAEFPGRSQ